MSQNLRTPKGRVSFASVFEPTDYLGDGQFRYRITLVFPPGADLSAMKNAAKAAVEKKWGDNAPKGLKSPFRDAGEKAGLDGFEDGATFINFTSKTRPHVVDLSRHEIGAAEFYNGCYAHVTCNPYAYDQRGGRGVAFGLGNVQKLADGEPFGGSARSDPEDDFGDVDLTPDGCVDDLAF